MKTRAFVMVALLGAAATLTFGLGSTSQAAVSLSDSASEELALIGLGDISAQGGGCNVCFTNVQCRVRNLGACCFPPNLLDPQLCECHCSYCGGEISCQPG